MSLNFERLDAAIDWAIAEDAKAKAGGVSLWDQRDWVKKTACGTACCLAGNIVIEAGYKPEFGCFKTAIAVENPVTGEAEEVSTAALGLLGVDYDHSVQTIFNSENDIEAIKRYRDYFARKAGVPTRFGYTEHETLGAIEEDLWARTEEEDYYE